VSLHLRDARINLWLVVGGVLSAVAAVIHLAAIVGGPAWYRFFGAGEEIAAAAARGSPVPGLMTLGIATVLLIWSAYAFAGAGLVRRLPLMRTALVLISAIYLLRGLVLAPALMQGEVDSFTLWSSLVVLVYGLAYAIGTWQAWPALRRRR
jgi:hypothetical protein